MIGDFTEEKKYYGRMNLKIKQYNVIKLTDFF